MTLATQQAARGAILTITKAKPISKLEGFTWFRAGLYRAGSCADFDLDYRVGYHGIYPEQNALPAATFMQSAETRWRHRLPVSK